MQKSTGYILNVEDPRRDAFMESIDYSGTFAEAVPEFDHSRNVPLVGFLSFEPEIITHLAMAHRGGRAATGMRRLNFREVLLLNAPIPHEDIIAATSARLRHFMQSRLERGGLLPPATFTEIVDIVRAIASDAKPLLDRFSRLRIQRINALRLRTREALAYQKETVATALAIAGLDRSPLQAWEPPVGEPQSFLDGLAEARVREDAMIVNDMAQVPGFDLVRTMPYGAAVFEGESARLTVVLANRLPLEQQYGADLIYYNETFNAFVIVQYKAMERDSTGPLFRLPNAQLSQELMRMDETLAHLRACQPNAYRDGYRLMENPFFLKLCPRIVFNPDDKGLTPGMYLPLDYWRLLEADETLVGPQSGRQVTYGNVGRHLDNTQFVALVANAWVGTATQQSALMATAIRSIIQSGRAVTLARKISVTPPGPVRHEDEDPVDFLERDAVS